MHCTFRIIGGFSVWWLEKRLLSYKKIVQFVHYIKFFCIFMKFFLEIMLWQKRNRKYLF